MSLIDRKYLKTYRGNTWVQRNEPCPCGNTYGGSVWLHTKGKLKGQPVFDAEGKLQERPVKFKHCCWHKYAVTDEVTQGQETERKKIEAYVAKKGKLPR
jgi:hypothetical protein